MATDDVSALFLAAAKGMRAQSGRMRAMAEGIAQGEAIPQSGTAHALLSAAMSGVARKPHAHAHAHTHARRAKGRPHKAENYRSQYDPVALPPEPSGADHVPELNMLMDMMEEMKDAQRVYEANLQTMDAARAMMARTVDLLRR